MTDTADEVARLKSLMWKRPFYLMTRAVADPPKMGPVVLDHYRYIIGLEKDGKIMASGPVFDEAGKQGAGITILRVDGWDEAVAIADADPFIASGGATYTMQRWQINEGRVSVSVDFSDMTMTAQ